MPMTTARPRQEVSNVTSILSCVVALCVAWPGFAGLDGANCAGGHTDRRHDHLG